LRLDAPLVGRRVSLREHVESDLDAYHAWRGDRAVMRFLSWRSRSREESRASLAAAIAEQSRTARTKYYLAALRLADGGIAGDVGLDLREDGEAGIGWFLLPGFQGQGIATEAAGLLIRFAFERLGLRAVVASCDSANRASARVLQKLGMTKVAEHPRASRTGTRLHYRLGSGNGDRPRS
jgi:RimJ/RimL family protein N-acetyltransferase